jgi:DNA-binding NarL/FixJ family response regulator
MTEANKTVLFMDDEYTSADIVKMAIEALRDAGFDVHTTDRMSEAMDAFYERYYHIFILDIDMSQVTDVQSGDGTDVARFLRALDSDTHIINFSARGKVHNWFAAANYHLFGYIHKNDNNSVDKLVALSEQASEIAEQHSQILRSVAVPQKAMIVNIEPQTTYTPAQIEQMLAATLADWELLMVSDIDHALHLYREGGLGLIVIMSDMFSTRPSAIDKIKSLCDTKFKPQVVIGCKGDEGAQPSILNIVNAQPFRMVDLLENDALHTLQQACVDASKNYGRKEIFSADPQALSRLRLNFSNEIYEHLEQRSDISAYDEAWEDDHLGEDFYKNSHNIVKDNDGEKR